MKINTEKYIVYIVCSIIYGGSLIMFPEIMSNITIAYMSLIGAFLGIDLAYTLKTTNSLPEGEYKDIKKSRYVLVGIITAVLYIITLVLKKVYKIDVDSSASLLGSSLLLIASMFIGVLEGNKLLTGTKPENTNG